MQGIPVVFHQNHLVACHDPGAFGRRQKDLAFPQKAQGAAVTQAGRRLIQIHALGLPPGGSRQAVAGQPPGETGINRNKVLVPHGPRQRAKGQLVGVVDLEGGRKKPRRRQTGRHFTQQQGDRNVLLLGAVFQHLPHSGGTAEGAVLIP